MQSNNSVNSAEVRKFDALALRWWDPKGPMRPLHAMNPVRVTWILRHIAHRFGAKPVRVLDVGCGAGLLSEALARAGCEVLGLDAAGAAIAAARAHAAGLGLKLAYRAGGAEELVAEGQKFPVVTALEVIEHVEDPAGFVAMLADLLEPGGLLFVSTLNRTARSWLTAKFGAEFLLRLLPAGTHDWKRFITPAELDEYFLCCDLRTADIAGMSFDPLRRGFKCSRDTSVNYIAVAQAASVL
jgi:2-polyprenyl-6-hydroxyphenyl methylase/3-demethylubiquinone-9 3-methyltransferase